MGKLNEIQGEWGAAEVARLKAALERREVPWVNDEGVTFVFAGEADRVFLRHWVYGLPNAMEMQRLPGSNLWVHRLQFPEGSRIEYKFGVVRGDREEWIHDPGNPNIAHDPFGGNSVVHCPGYAVPDWTVRDPEVPQGTLLNFDLTSRAFGDHRSIGVWLPPGFRDYRRYRLLVVHDGNDYLRFSSLDIVLENLMAALEIPPLVVALTNPHDRLREYADDPRHAEFLVREVLPELEKRFPLIGEASGRCLMGASFGAVASLSTAWRFPEAFGSLILQSGSFAFTDIGQHSRSPVFDNVVRFVNDFRREPGEPAERVFVSCGTYESLIYENRSMVPFLQGLGIDTGYVEARDGHNWENWRDRLREALSWVFPGPLWVTYM